jgi:hemoglobin/transferrin/lactoferrin receptor protein
VRASAQRASIKIQALEWDMGLVGRNAAVLLSGAAMTLLLGAQAGRAQQAGQQPDVVVNAEEQAGQPMDTAPVDTSSVTVLDRITIVSRTGESAIEQMASVSHVDEEQIERRMATTPQDILFGVPGVAMQSDANRTASSVNIRGLQDFGRVAVIVDGARQNFQRSGHGTQSMFWLDPELIQQVDVIRGPVANTYGSGAIGGVVMFETKDADDFLREGETWAGSLSGQFDSNGKGWTTSGTGAYRFNDSFDVLGNIVWRDFDDYKDGNGDDVAGSSFDILSGILKSTIRPTENSELKLGWIGANDSWTEGGNTSELETKQNTFTGRYNIKDENESWLDLHINAAYNKTNLDQTYLTDVARYSSVTGLPIIIPAGSQTTYDIETPSFDLWNTSRFDTGAVSHELTYGGDWIQDDVVTTSPEGGSDIYTPSGKRRVSGAYIQEKLVWEWLEVVGALRYDSYKLDSDVGDTSGDRLSPRITVGVSPFEQLGFDGLDGLQLYGTYAEGYRSPSLSETLISGLHPNGVVFPFLPNPNLKPETAHTVEFGVNYSRDGIFQADDSLRLKAAYFHNDIDDYIGGATLMAVGPTADPICTFTPGPGRAPFCFQYRNFANAEIRGFELESVYDAAWGFAGLSMSIIDGHTVSYDGERADLSTIPSSQVTGQLGFRFLEDKLVVGGEVQYNGAPKGNPIADDYTLVNLFASYQATDDLKFNARVDNLFDATYTNPLNASTTDIIYEPGISVKVGASLRFGG